MGWIAPSPSAAPPPHHSQTPPSTAASTAPSTGCQLAAAQQPRREFRVRCPHRTRRPSSASSSRRCGATPPHAACSARRSQSTHGSRPWSLRAAMTLLLHRVLRRPGDRQTDNRQEATATSVPAAMCAQNRPTAGAGSGFGMDTLWGAQAGQCFVPSGLRVRGTCNSEECGEQRPEILGANGELYRQYIRPLK
jgi:hypothetical protein